MEPLKFIIGNSGWKDEAGNLVPVHSCQLEDGVLQRVLGQPTTRKSQKVVIPRAWAEEAYREYVKQYPTLPKLEQLEERGGFGIAELIRLLMDVIARERASSID